MENFLRHFLKALSIFLLAATSVYAATCPQNVHETQGWLPSQWPNVSESTFLYATDVPGQNRFSGMYCYYKSYNGQATAILFARGNFNLDNINKDWLYNPQTQSYQCNNNITHCEFNVV